MISPYCAIKVVKGHLFLQQSRFLANKSITEISCIHHIYWKEKTNPKLFYSFKLFLKEVEENLAKRRNLRHILEPNVPNFVFTCFLILDIKLQSCNICENIACSLQWPTLSERKMDKYCYNRENLCSNLSFGTKKSAIFCSLLPRIC